MFEIIVISMQIGPIKGGNKSQRKDTVISSFNKTAYKKTDINPNGGQIMKTCLEYTRLNIYKFLISQNIFADLHGPKEKYKLHYGL